jgi:hypothetical protein
MSISAHLDFKAGVAFNGSAWVDVATAMAVTRSQAGPGVTYIPRADGLFSGFAANTLRRTNLGATFWNGVTNLVPWSNDLTKVAAGEWAANTGITASTFSGTKPDGTTGTISQISTGVANSAHMIGISRNFTNGNTYLGSYLVQQGTARYLQIQGGSGAFTNTNFQNFDLQLGIKGTASGVASSGTASGIIVFANGWILIWAAFTANASAASAHYLGIVTSASAARQQSFLGTNLTANVVWAQLENTTQIIPAPRTPTAGATVAVGGDVPVLSGAFATAARAANAIRAKTNGVAGGSSAPRIIDFNGTQEIQFITTTTVRINNGTSQQSATIGSAGTQADAVTSAFGMDATNCTALANGGAKATLAAAWGTPSGNVYVANRAAGDRGLCGVMEHLTFGTAKGQFDANTITELNIAAAVQAMSAFTSLATAKITERASATSILAGFQTAGMAREKEQGSAAISPAPFWQIALARQKFRANAASIVSGFIQAGRAGTRMDSMTISIAAASGAAAVTIDAPSAALAISAPSAALAIRPLNSGS